ncbi:hypothetical protein Py04_0459 [Pyrococcus sp. ST04]|nr:hypothetical protein Py04_0459 [Pyrococcus sp. ST04]
MEGLPPVTILILNWNGKDVTYNCVSSIIRNTDYPRDKLKIIVIDNGSTDGSYYYLKRKLYQFRDVITVIRLKKNYYFIRGNNIGISYVLEHFDPDYILLLNNDTKVIQKDWLRKLVELAESDDKIAIVGPKLIFPNGIIQWSARKKEKNPFFLILQTITARLNPGFGEHEEQAISANFIGEVNTISGACMLIRTEFVKKYGKLDISLYPMYQEDVEYSFRAWKHGYKVMYRGDVKVIHYEGYSMESKKLDELEYKKFYWALRNSILVSLRYFGFWKVIIFGLLIYLFVTFFDKKDKTKKLGITNIALKKNVKARIKILKEIITEIKRRNDLWRG